MAELNDDVQLVLVICFAILIGLFLFSAGASYFDLTPPLMIDVGEWVSDNTLLIAFVLCFSITMLAIIKIKGGHRHE
jgi:hypothetical protein